MRRYAWVTALVACGFAGTAVATPLRNSNWPTTTELTTNIVNTPSGNEVTLTATVSLPQGVFGVYNYTDNAPNYKKPISHVRFFKNDVLIGEIPVIQGNPNIVGVYKALDIFCPTGSTLPSCTYYYGAAQRATVSLKHSLSPTPGQDVFRASFSGDEYFSLSSNSPTATVTQFFDLSPVIHYLLTN